MTDKQHAPDAQSLIAGATNPYDLNVHLKPVDWAELRERVDPQGDRIPAEELIDRTFTIVSLKPFDSSFEGKREVVYFIKAVDEDGVLFNTILGGEVVCQALDAFSKLNEEYHKANRMGDRERAIELEDIGAGHPVMVTLRKSTGGKFDGYYTFD